MNKVAYYKGYMEKEALNAQKARVMAKKFGIIPEPTSAWKWALRQMRKGKNIGETPPALAKKIRKMGRGSSVEYGALFGPDVKKNKLGRIVKGVGGDQPAVDVFRSFKEGPLNKGMLAKTMGDPEGLKLLGFSKNKLKEIVRNAKKFDKILGRTSSVHLHPPISKKVFKTNISEYKKFLNNPLTEELVKPEIAHLKKLIKHRKGFGGVSLSGWNPFIKKPVNGITGDYGSFLLAAPNKTHNIISQKVQGIHKIRPADKGGVRSVYLNK